MPRVRIPTPISGGLMLSYKCSAACRHCMYACSPRWPGDWITLEDLESVLSHLAKTIQPSPWGEHGVGLNDGLHFSGGEPFLNFDLLLRAVELAGQLRIPSTFVETNCFWCADDETTREKLERLKAASLKGIMISVNPYYAEYVPFERTERCIRTSLEVFGQNAMVYQVEFYRRFKRMGVAGRISLEDYLARTKPDSLSRNVELFLAGRATRSLREFYDAYPSRVFFGEPCLPPLLRNWHNHFDNYGNFMPGYCGGISLGSWRNLPDLLREGIELEDYPVLAFLIHGDMEGLLHFAQDFGYRESPGGYLSKCHLCLDLRSYLVSRDDFDELSPKAFYAQLEKEGGI